MTPDYKKIMEHVLGADFINATQKNASFSFPKPLITVDKNITKITRDIEKLRFSLVGYPLRNTILKDYDTINSLVYPRNSLMNTALNIALENIKNNRFHCEKIKPLIPRNYDPSCIARPTQEPNPSPLSPFPPLNPSAPSPTEQILNSFSLEGDYWCISFNGETKIIKNTLGMRYIKYLIQNKGKEIHVSELFYHEKPPPEHVTNTALSALGTRQLEAEGLSISNLGDTGPLMDETGKKALKSHIKKLDQQIEDAIEFGDIDKAEELKNEKEQILTPLSTDFGLGGKPRKIDSPVEKVRKRVEKRISTDIKKLGKSFPQLSKHLACINTGTQCKYDPYPDISWKLD